MKILIVGLGVQGQKRKKLINKNYFFASVDNKNKNADFKSIEDVPVDKYTSVFVCTPDSAKLKILNYCIKHKKHALIEKPLVANLEIKIKILVRMIFYHPKKSWYEHNNKETCVIKFFLTKYKNFYSIKCITTYYKKKRIDKKKMSPSIVRNFFAIYQKK